MLTKQYEIETSKSKEAILSDQYKKIELQKKNKFISFDLINYSSFKLHDDQIEKWPSMFNPFRGIGTIHFNFDKSIKGTTIRCTLEPYWKFGLTESFGCLSG